jgi:hypothetical protein
MRCGEANERVSMVKARLAGIGLLVASLGCSSSTPATKNVRLPSGKQIRVRSVGPILFTQAPPGLALSYETDLRVSDREALRREAIEIWQSFRVDADRAKVQSAVIMAYEKPTGFIIMHSQSYNFVFARANDGSWPSEPAPSK